MPGLEGIGKRTESVAASPPPIRQGRYEISPLRQTDFWLLPEPGEFDSQNRRRRLSRRNYLPLPYIGQSTESVDFSSDFSRELISFKGRTHLSAFFSLSSTSTFPDNPPPISPFPNSLQRQKEGRNLSRPLPQMPGISVAAAEYVRQRAYSLPDILPSISF